MVNPEGFSKHFSLEKFREQQKTSRKNTSSKFSFLSTVLKLTLLHGCLSRFLNCTNGTKSRNAPRISPHGLSKT